MQETRDSGSIPGQEDPLEEGIVAHSSILAWRIPWTEEATVHRVAQSQTGLKRLGTLYDCIPEKAMAPHSSTLAWKIPWTEEPGGLQSMGSLTVGYD